MAKHSSIVGGSTASRLLGCPGSYQATLKLPPSADISSEYANEGTAMHEVMSFLMGGAAGPSAELAQTLVGMQFHDRVLTQDHLDSMILPALEAFWKLLGDYNVRGWDYRAIEIETRVVFPGIPGAIGTCDVLLRYGDHVFLVDWKFGAGIPVEAVYRDPEGDLINPQLMFYATAAMASYRRLLKGAKVLVVAIIQPRAATPLSYTTVTRRDIKWFTEDLQSAVMAALARNPFRQKGEWCRFAPCKIDCPLWTAPMLELAAVDDAKGAAKTLLPTPYGEYLARAKALVDLLAMFGKEVNDQLHAYLSDGGEVPGWRLKAKAKQRQWVDEGTVENALFHLGFNEDEIYQRKLQTFIVADAAAKRLGVVIPDELRVAPATTETTVCRTDDPAPVIEKRVVIEEFAKALQKL